MKIGKQDDQVETLAQRAKRLREELGLTQEQVAQRANISATHVYHIETGRRHRMRTDTLERYAAALGVSSKYLDMGYEAPPQGEADTWPTVAVTLRHTSELTEAEIRQVERFVKALEMQHEMDDASSGGAERGKVTQLRGGR